MPTAKKKLAYKTFRSKLLLFGEHIINTGAKGLAVPTGKFSGRFDFIKEELNESAIASNRSIQELAGYIIHDAALCKLYDTNALLTDLEHGLYFHSNIPQGYGLGSSGALIAALCAHYRLKPVDRKDLTAIKAELAKLESFYHGKSSGLDPLVSFMDQAVLLDGGEVKETFDLKPGEKGYFKVFVLNTKKARKTAPYVKLFLQKYKDPKFRSIIDESLVKANDMCIKSLLKPGYSTFWKSLKLISQIHYDHLPEFIPDAYREIWKSGLINNEYYLKICGAGGGGFILGFCKKDAPIRDILSHYEIVELMEF